MASLELAGRRLAIGLQWAFVEKRGEVRQRVQQAAAEPGRAKQRIHYVIAQNEEGMLLGIEADAQAVNPAEQRKPTKRYAGALLAAQVLQDAIIFETIAPDLVWVCAVRHGLPLPGMDRLTTLQEANQVVQDVRSYTPTPVILVGNHPEAGMTLAKLLEEVEPDMLRASRMQHPTDSARVAFYVTLLVACGLATWGLLHAPQTSQTVATHAPLAPLLGPSDDDIRSGDALLLAKAREAALKRPDATALTAAWRRLLRGLPYGVGGYRPSQADCRQENCQLQWDWHGERFERHYLARLPGERQPGQTPGEYMRRVQTRLAIPNIPERQLDALRPDTLDDWALALIMQARRTGARIEVAAPTQEIDVKLPPLRDGKPRTQLIAREGRISVIASGWAAIQALLDVLAQATLSIERSVYNITGSSISMQLEARYVVLAD